ncbi:terminase TerL endonuclease subunit [Parasedimentitalea psychrophila]|uniref:Terminase large subunit n=1 Tax=Parasedimentitalea psychrophila TaxID=2997337 RepID=A0A9Y2L1F9_9RHOB|nr:terminase TerL endonuclease subunit [Parasedimentitalea psychrophila]WIY26951.1 terminase large subunit [Parasedimentitalea psychrophila]
MKASTKAIRFLETLAIPEGPKAGELIKLAPFQKKFVRGALADGVQAAVLSIGRGNAKTALSAGIALGAVMGKWDTQPRREILIAARTRDQARIAFDFVVGFMRSLSDEEKKLFTVRRSPRLEIEYDGDGGGHVIRAISADGKSALGSAPTLVLMDERGHWMADQGDALEHALLSGMGKRGGRALIISTSAPDDAHPFSVWLDEVQEGVYVQEHRPAPGLPADDKASLKEANPGAVHGIGSSLEWLQGQARRAIARGGSTLTSYRLYNRNERVSGETRDVLLTVDEWLNCEVSEVPARKGQVVIGVDLGGSASMTAAAFYWPDTGRLECLGTFPSKPTLLDRGQNDGVSGRYVEMNARCELSTLGDQTVPVAPWLMQVMAHVEGETVAAITADRYKQAELGEAIDKAGIRCPIIWRGQGFKDGGEDCERFRRAAYDGKVQTSPSLLLRSAFADAVTLRDPANNLKLAKARSTGRIDPAAATVLAVAEGARMMGRPTHKGGRIAWG